MKLGFLGGAALAAVLLLGAPGAFAFKIMTPEDTGGAGLNLADPGAGSDHFSTQSRSAGPSQDSNTRTLHFGSTTLQFGSGPVDNYGLSPFLRDRFLDNPASRTVPSQR